MKNMSLILLKVNIPIDKYCFQEIRKNFKETARSFTAYDDVDHRIIKMKKISEKWILIYDNLTQPGSRDYIYNLRTACNYLAEYGSFRCTYVDFCIGILCENEKQSSDSNVSLFIKPTRVLPYFIESIFPYGITEKKYIEIINDGSIPQANIDATFLYKVFLNNESEMQKLIKSTSQHQSVEFIKLFLKQFEGLEDYDIDDDVIWDKEYCYKFKSYL